ncbi:prenyltransferase/squalene oxidase repeat-containing protein [Phytohabitans rumicis]|uniref:prenyltransferase/squalene oxidase repeat-containing protein n=1 Tax=Phytohabitans rumicis TaxID=1076125 RepID=UPI001FE29BE5|nr:prenyltransferase/squalene oxidase repeat-containing protein [Phytohabitans rumicis]
MRVDVGGAARQLVAGLVAEPWGRVTPSVYETGRLVTLAPWLAGHRQRIAFLLRTQRADGGWGGPDGYALVPTLSATEALLATGDGDRVRAAAERGLAALTRWGRGVRQSIPDMPAIELIVPALTELVNDHLDRHDRPRLPLPAGIDGARLGAVRAALAAGRPAPEKLLHAWEVVGGAAPDVRPQPPGTVGASPAATAAWLGGRGAPDATGTARQYLEAAVRRYGGPVPCATPITVFERAWTLSWLAEAGVPVTVPDVVLRELADAVGANGTPAGPGLPQDADTTAVALYALAQLGREREPDSLWAYETETHFCTWPGEEGRSATVNAHVLEAFGHYVAERPDAAPRYGRAVQKLTAWLHANQEADGAWRDRWHASPYYATACCAPALARFGSGPAATEAVGRAVDWVISTQRADGSWGWWRGTAEETAYAVRVLLARPDEASGRAVARGYPHLVGAVRRRSVGGSADPAMWHDKDLYLPRAIVRAAVLAAVHQAQRSFS